jgi:flagellar hook-associated protein 2
VQITRASNTITDLIDGYEFKLNTTTSSTASVIASIDSDLAYSTVKGFVDMFNSVNTTLDNLTNNGVDGTEKGALARDVVVSGIKRNIRSIVTDALPGFEDNPRYISELGIRTERDGSLSLTEEDFKENFSREPILFDVMVNSLARTNNPLVTASHTSDILQPKGGIYSFSETSVDGENASLNGVALSGGVSNGIRGYAAVTGDTAGLRLQASGGAQNATIYYGESFLSKLSSYIKDLTGPIGTLAQSTTEANATISDYTDEQINLEEKIAAMTDRYMGQFAAMETAVTGFKKTGEFLTGFIDSMKPKD